MKTDRLIAIVMYLLNRQVVSASTLAERFEVSKRTIQRDIEALCMAGIPIAATYGAEGGYEIEAGFRLEKGIVNLEDYVNILSAMRGLASTFENDAIGRTLDKVMPVSRRGRQSVFLDLSAANEGMDGYLLRDMEEAVRQRKVVQIRYCDSQGKHSDRTLEPLALSYRWYAWYLFAYCPASRDYRLFKLIRISSWEMLDRAFSRQHGDADTLMQTRGSHPEQDCYSILLQCKESARQAVKEYFKGEIEEGVPGRDFLFRMAMPKRERMWFSLLLGFGTDVVVLEPEELRRRMEMHTRALAELYAQVP